MLFISCVSPYHWKKWLQGERLKRRHKKRYDREPHSLLFGVPVNSLCHVHFVQDIFSCVSFICVLLDIWRLVFCSHFSILSQPTFLTKEQRAMEALKRRQQQVEEQRKKTEVFKKEDLTFINPWTKDKSSFQACISNF